MQYPKVFSILLVGVLAGIQACAAQNASYRLYVEPSTILGSVYNWVSWVNGADGGALSGNVKTQQIAEPMIVNLATDGTLSFLTYHADRYQNWYIFTDQVKPVGLTTWQSIPANATTTGFTIDSAGYLRYQSEDNWAVCPSAVYTNSYQIFYVGGGNPIPDGCVATKVKAQAYGACSATS